MKEIIKLKEKEYYIMKMEIKDMKEILKMAYRRKRHKI